MYIELENLEHHFPGHDSLFAGLAASLLPGRVYALTGPSGSGKSTLLGIIAGWIVPTGGQVKRVDVQTVGWVFQNPHGVSRRSALDHVSFPFISRGAGRRDAEDQAMRLLERFGLDHVASSQFRALSGGEAQRLMLARGIAVSPDLLLVDEPTAQLDQQTAATVSASLSRLATEGVIVIVATHDRRTKDACTDVIDLEQSA